MDINIRCPHCHEALAISDDEVDLRVNCPMCHKTFVWGEILRAKEQERRAEEEPQRLRTEDEAKERQILEKQKQEQARQLEAQREAAAQKAAEQRRKAREEEMAKRAEQEASGEAQSEAAERKQRHLLLIVLAAVVIIVVMIVLLKQAGAKKVYGHAWVVRNSGASDILRGMKVYLCRAEIQKSSYLESDLQSLLQSIRNIKETELDLYLPRYIREDPHRKQWWLDHLREDKRDLERLINRDQDLTLSLQEIYQMRSAANFWEPLLWKRVWREAIQCAIVKETTTDFEGKYVFDDIGRGEYYVYARFEAELGWLIPVREAKEGKIDLYNANANIRE